MLLLLTMLACVRPDLHGALVFADPTEFQAAALLPTTTLDFESLAPGTAIPSGSAQGGIEFLYSLGQLQMTVDDTFLTVSGTRYLGLADPDNFNQFVAGDSFSLAFGPSRGLALYFLTTDRLFADDIQVITSIGTARNAADPLQQFGDGGLVYFLGLLAEEGDPSFTTAQIAFAPEASETFLYNVDDITLVPEPTTAPVPEPGTGAFSGLAIAAVVAILSRRVRS